MLLHWWLNLSMELDDFWPLALASYWHTSHCDVALYCFVLHISFNRSQPHDTMMYLQFYSIIIQANITSTVYWYKFYVWLRPTLFVIECMCACVTIFNFTKRVLQNYEDHGHFDQQQQFWSGPNDPHMNEEMPPHHMNRPDFKPRHLRPPPPAMDTMNTMDMAFSGLGMSIHIVSH